MSKTATVALPLTRPQREAVVRALDEQGQQPGALLPVLHAVQDALGFIPPASVEMLAQALSLSRAEVHGVITYYHHFRQTPPGQHVLQICQAEACRACDSPALMEQAQQLLRCEAGQMGRTASGVTVTLQAAYCLGLCASAPALSLDEDPQGRVTPESLSQLMAQLSANRQEAA